MVTDAMGWRGPAPPSAAELIDSMQRPMSAFENDGRYSYINRAGLELLAMSAEQVLGRRYLELFPDLATHPFHHVFQKVASGESSFERLEFFYEPMGLWSSQDIHRAGAFVVVTWENITARKTTEALLERALSRAEDSERQLRVMIEHMPLLAWTAGADGFIDYYNPRWYEFTGTSPEEMEGWGWQSVHGPAILPEVLQRWQAAIASGEPFEMQFPLRSAGGVFRWFLTRAAPVRNEDGVVMRWVGINTDIDDQRTALERLDETLESMSDAFVLVDREWRITRVNRRHEQLSRVPREQSLGRVFWDIFPEAAHESSPYWQSYHRVMQERVPFGFVERYASLDLWTEVDAFPHRDGGIAIFWRDISERKRAEEAMVRSLETAEQARKEAEEAARIKDEFLATVSHELRTPLNSILGWGRMLQSGALDADNVRKAVDAIVRNAIAQNRLIDDLLDVSRIIAGNLRLTVESVDIPTCVEAAVDSIRPAAEAKGVRLQVVLDPNAGHVAGDSDRLQQVIWNLLSNAVKFTPKGGRVHLTLRREDSHVALEVGDTGAGIAAEFLPYVFHRFRQQDGSVTRSSGGLGLGLAIVKNLVELHGGEVSAASEGAGKGATFTVRIPVAPLKPRAVQAQPSAHALPEEDRSLVCPKELEGLHVLVVDDELDAREMLKIVLERCRARVTTASNAAEALMHLRETRPDVIVSDIGMPFEDGYTLLRKVRSLPKEAGGRTPAVALTAYARGEDRRRALAAGFQNHAAKPIDPQELVIIVANLAGRFET